VKDFFSAIRFITILPTGKPGRFDAGAMLPYFPLVGLLLGGIVAVVDGLALRLWNPAVASLIDVVLLGVLTGGFHLDGLGDTADGLFSHRSKERALEIMKDSRIGSQGVLAIVFVLALKWAGITHLTAGRSLLLVLVPAYARGAALFGIRSLPYGRIEGGTGRGFFEKKMPVSAFWALAVPIGFSVAAGSVAITLNIGFFSLVALVLLYYRRQMGCITGDMLGAMIEFSEAALFLLAAAS
jgi:adenosylcobinamide-GDP ribazoletransferase